MSRTLIIAVVVLAACAKAPPRLPEPMAVAEIPIPWENAFPSDLVVDDAGRVWFTDRLTHVIGRYDPERQAFDRFEPPTAKSAPYGLIRTPDGVLWYAASQGHRIGRIDPVTAEITEYPIPGLTRAGPHLLAHTPGRVWFTAREARSWGWLDLATGEVVVREMPAAPTGGRFTQGTRPYSIAAGRDGVWIGAYESPEFFHVRAGVDTLEEHPLVRRVPLDSARVRTLRSGPDSVAARIQIERMSRDAIAARRSASDARGRIYIGDFVRGRIARFDPATNVIEVFPFIDRSSATYGIGVDAWDRIWSYQMYAQQVVMIDPKTEQRAVARLRSSGTVRQIGFDTRRRRVWLPISDSGVLGLIQL